MEQMAPLDASGYTFGASKNGLFRCLTHRVCWWQMHGSAWGKCEGMLWPILKPGKCQDGQLPYPYHPRLGNHEHTMAPKIVKLMPAPLLPHP